MLWRIHVGTNPVYRVGLAGFHGSRGVSARMRDVSPTIENSVVENITIIKAI
jgi:hypothetical protein